MANASTIRIGTAWRRARGSRRHQRLTSVRWVRPASSAALARTFTPAAPGSLRSLALRRPLAEQALGAEDQDQDQDAEDDGLGPLGSRRADREALVEGLDQPD